MTYQLMAHEFPDFDQATLPAIPAHWEDTSWRNDAMPSFRTGRHWIMIDYANDADRETQGGKRFCTWVFDMDKDEQASDADLVTDDWGALLAKVEAKERADLAAEYVALVGYDPFEDDPGNTNAEVRQMIAEIRELDARGGLDA